MYLKRLEITGFKSFAKKETLDFNAAVSAIVGPNGSGKSNIAEAFRFVLGEQSIKSMRGKKGEDLIFNGGSTSARANRASVKIVFNNEPDGGKRLFDTIDFDEVTIERVVHRDGMNQYRINDSQVRLRDVVELLARANIGASGHHIISQGEADRILNTSPRERREMIEDALGLKVYQYKLKESEKKLEKTRENIAQVEALRKEIAPHMKFLKKQVERVEKAEELKVDLKKRYREYLKRESVYIAVRKSELTEGQRAPRAELAKLEKELTEAKAVLEREHKGDSGSEAIIELEGKLRAVREEKERLGRDLGRLEGEIAAEARAAERAVREGGVSEERMVRLASVRVLLDEVKGRVDEAEDADNIAQVREIVRSVYSAFRRFVEEEERRGGEVEPPGKEALDKLEREQTEKNAQHRALEADEAKLRAEYQKMQKEIETVRDKSREAERAIFTIMTREQELRNTLATLEYREKELARDEEAFKRELEEGAFLAGREVLNFEDYVVVGSSGAELSEADIAAEPREKQEARRREIEKIKIRIEEFGAGGGDDVLKEYKEIEERDQFLAREIADLETSAASLKEIMKELEETLQVQFKEGIAKINTEFERFFALMFGGGKAALKLVEAERRRTPSPLLLEGEGVDDDDAVMEEEQREEGIDISVSLPRKRIKGLVMLSGGERALTSIALLFAMSQVNPPPFLILDETDAALDEANSKRYGDMVESLAQYSQLIVITHNRETMSRASILYGVTMGGDSVSKLLSVKFEDAVKVAK